jgi:hypothetical protein
MATMLVALVMLPLYWLLDTSLRDAAGALTIANYRTLFVDPRS